jgi:hypothetical protein
MTACTRYGFHALMHIAGIATWIGRTADNVELHCAKLGSTVALSDAGNEMQATRPCTAQLRVTCAVT